MMLGEEEENLFTGRFTDDAITLWIGAPGPDTLELTAELHDKASRHRLDKSNRSIDIFNNIWL